MSCLLDACQEGNEEKVIELVRSGASLLERDEQGMSSFLFAIESGNINLIKWLVENGSDISERDKRGLSGVLLAAYAGHTHVMEWLLKKGISLQDKSLVGNTPLLLASRKPIIQWLLDHGSSVHERNKWGQTPLLRACLTAKVDAIELLLQHDASLEERCNDGNNALIYASTSGNVELMKWLIEHNCAVHDCTPKFGSPIIQAANNGLIEVARVLVEHGASLEDKNDEGDATDSCRVSLTDVDCEGANVVLVGVKYEQAAIVEYLLSLGITAQEKDIRGSTPLLIAIVQGHMEILKMLLEGGHSRMDEKDNFEFTPMLSAFGERGTIEMILYLKEKGASFDEVNHANRNVLLLAAQSGRLDLLKWLVEEQGMDIDVTDERGFNALQLAAEEDRLDVVQWLVQEMNFDLSQRDSKNFTILLHCACRGQVRTVEYLVELGSDLFAETSGFDAIHLATTGGHVEMVEWLSNHGFSLTMENIRTRHAPINCVQYCPNTIEMLEYFVDKGVDINSGSYTALHSFSGRKDSMAELKWLIAHGARVDIKDYYGNTALLLAAEKGFIEVVKYLITQGASGQERGIANRTALHFAAISGNVEMISYCIEELQLNISDKDLEGYTPLLNAASASHLKAIQCLLAYGSSDEESNNDGDTIFSISNQKGYEEELQALFRSHRAKTAKLLPS